MSPNQHLTAFIAISGDFNNVTMDKTLSNFTQYVDCPTREEITLDLLYANVKEAYSCPPPGRSDHNLVNLSSCATGEESACEHRDIKEMV